MLQNKKEINKKKKYNNQIKRTAHKFYASICSKTQKVFIQMISLTVKFS